MVDETWAVAAEGEGRFNPRVLLGAGVTLYAAWVLGTVVGVTFGDVIGDPDRLGLDAAFPALFLALLVPQLTNRRAVEAAVLGAAIALALTPFMPAGVPIIAASAACLLGLRRSPRRGAVGMSEHAGSWSSWSASCTIAIKALGPDAARRQAPARRHHGVVVLLAPALLAALVAVNTLGGDRELVVDARLPGVLAAAVAIRLRAPVLVGGAGRGRRSRRSSEPSSG